MPNVKRKNVYFAAAIMRAELDCTHHSNTKPRALGGGFGQSRERVVIGKCDRGKSGRMCCLYHCRWSE